MNRRVDEHEESLRIEGIRVEPMRDQKPLVQILSLQSVY
jgi:hypothetical protein